ncbi:hypothetical protein LTR37_012383 [Vermiconidia calcicola]|uniref:Uncharacterized protein n=1 Tax=Vermiconidia calcicola TaxID=1690605 RepID=A0ACC3N2B5_9PEZI|nr:hypothetical protein LTR37_012383 [Vermiconidia calcicola]
MASFPASFVRGGTSNGLIIDCAALPQDQAEWQPVLSSAMGSPDPYGRQLNGMGSGISSTSKICVISESNRDDADVDYTFVQVGIKGGDLDMAGNCGNMSSAVGPVAWDQGLANGIRKGDEMTVRMFNVNTSKIVHSTFSINAKDSKYEPCGEYSIDGVPGNGSRITLSFQDPAGSKTGKALPTGNTIDTLDFLPDGTKIQASLVDVANPGVFVRAQDLDIPGDITPDILGADSKIMARLEEVRRAGAQLMGLDPNVQSVPKTVLVSKTEGENSEMNIVCRALSMQQPHKAVPLTLALNLGTACKMPGTIPATVAIGVDGKDSVVVAHASGKVEVGSVVKDGNVKSVLLHRTARVLMKGEVFYTLEHSD